MGVTMTDLEQTFLCNQSLVKSNMKYEKAIGDGDDVKHLL